MGSEGEANTLGNQHVIPTPLGNRRRSPVWKEFLQIDGKDTKDGKLRAVCKHCKIATFIATSEYGTGNTNKHLKKCTAYAAYLLRVQSGGEPYVFEQKVYRELVAKAIIKHGYAFSWIEHDGNRAIHAYLNNQVKTICRNTIKSDCLKLHANLKARLKEVLNKVSGRISLTSDMWTSCQTEGYMCLTAHYVDENWKLNCRVLNFSHIESPHTGRIMYTNFLDMIQEWGISSKIFSVTLDNASSNDKMQDYLKDTLNSQGVLLHQGSYFHVRCAAHVLNLIVKEGLKVIDPIILKIRDSVKYVKWSETRKQIFRRCVKHVNLQEKKALWLDVPTRWNSIYMMLDRAILYRDAFVQMEKLTTCSYSFCPDSEEWDMLEQIRDVLEPFSVITDLFSGSNYPTANMYFKHVWKIAMLLKDLVKSDNKVIQLMGFEMQLKFDKYWLNSSEDDYGTLFAFAMILDPRCKLNVLKFCYKKLYDDDETKAEAKVKNVRLKLEAFFREYTYGIQTVETPTPTQNPTPCSVTSIPKNTRTTMSGRKRPYNYLDAYDNEEDVYSTHAKKTELDIYLEDDKLDRKMHLTS